MIISKVPTHSSREYLHLGKFVMMMAALQQMRLIGGKLMHTKEILSVFPFQEICQIQA